MNPQIVFTFGQEGLYTLLMVAAPMLLTVLADGWNLLLGSLAASFAT